MGWCHGLEDVEATLRCQGSDHRLRWRAGRLQLLDHDDLAGEHALVALGARPPSCLDVLEACRRHLLDAGELALWDADVDPLVGPPGARSPADERRLDVLRSLPTPFRRRLALGALVAAGRRTPAPTADDPSTSALVRRLLVPALLGSLAAAGEDRLTAGALDVRWTPLAAGERPHAEGEAGERGGWARVRVSPAWAAAVWAHSAGVGGGAGPGGVSGRWMVLHTARTLRSTRSVLAARWVPGRRGRLQLVTEVVDGRTAGGPRATASGALR